jgi:hypothetical protein
LGFPDEPLQKFETLRQSLLGFSNGGRKEEKDEYLK